MKSLEIMESASFKINELNGYKCYKEQNGRFYHCFVNKNEALNDGLKYTRISKSEYDSASEESLYRSVD